MSEVRLISLYKMASQNNPNSDPSHSAELATDGQFTFDQHTLQTSMRTYTHSASSGPDNKLWIELGGHFKIQKITIHNLRHCCQEQLVGTHVYADDRLIGTVIVSSSVLEFLIPEVDAVYASKILLHQPLAHYINVLEIQVWGTGPFLADDLF
jgi:hypothetical protein